MANRGIRSVAAVLIGFFFIDPMLDLLPTLPSSTEDFQRLRRLSVYPWARDHLRPLTAMPDSSKETVLFWHIPKVSDHFFCNQRIDLMPVTTNE